MEDRHETVRCTALRNEAWRRGYCVITRVEAGQQTSRAYAVDCSVDFSATRDTELNSLEAVMNQVRLFSNEDSQAPPHPPARARYA